MENNIKSSLICPYCDGGVTYGYNALLKETPTGRNLVLVCRDCGKEAFVVDTYSLRKVRVRKRAKTSD